MGRNDFDLEIIGEAKNDRRRKDGPVGRGL